jgi:hypothetical protein
MQMKRGVPRDASDIHLRHTLKPAEPANRLAPEPPQASDQRIISAAFRRVKWRLLWLRS